MRDTRGLAFGPGPDALSEPPQAIVAYDTPLEPYTGDLEVTLDSGWEAHGTVHVRQAHPLPATLLSLIPDVAVSSR